MYTIPNSKLERWKFTRNNLLCTIERKHCKNCWEWVYSLHEFTLYFKIENIFSQIFQIYGIFTQKIFAEIQEKGITILNFSHIKKYRAIRKSIINLFSTFISKTSSPNEIYNQYFPEIFKLLQSHSESCVEAREPEILKLFSICIDKMSNYIDPAIPNILGLTFSSTLDMITKDLNSYPDHRINFFQLLKSVVINSLKCNVQD